MNPITYNMKPIAYGRHPHPWNHSNWNRLQLRYFSEKCKIRREKNIEDYIINNGHERVHIIKDNDILTDFLTEKNIQVVPPEQADLIIITDQRFSRYDVQVMIEKLHNMLAVCPRIYFALNWYYFNANESHTDPDLPENYHTAITAWFNKQLPYAITLNRSEIFHDDGSYFSWVISQCELLICRK